MHLRSCRATKGCAWPGDSVAVTFQAIGSHHRPGYPETALRRTSRNAALCDAMGTCCYGSQSHRSHSARLPSERREGESCGVRVAVELCGTRRPLALEHSGWALRACPSRRAGLCGEGVWVRDRERYNATAVTLGVTLLTEPDGEHRTQHTSRKITAQHNTQRTSRKATAQHISRSTTHRSKVKSHPIKRTHGQHGT